MMKTAFLIAFLFLVSASIFGQNRLKGNFYTYATNGGLCSTVIGFINDSLFSSNHGCEGLGYTYYGKYRIKSDSLFLEDGIRHTGLRILKMDSSRTSGNLLTLRFYNQHGENISKQFSAYYYRENDRRYGISYDSIQNALVAPEIGIKKVVIRTMELLGLETGLDKTNFSTALTVNYHIEIPEFITQLQLWNKDIGQTGNSVLLIRKDRLIPASEERYPFPEGPVIYEKTKY